MKSNNKSLKLWRLVKSKYLLKSRWLNVRADTCLTSNGTVIDPYYVLEYPDWVHMVIVDNESKILVTQQYRHAAKAISLGLPAGTVEKADESPLAAAKRELLEENGYTGNFTLVGVTTPNPATQTNSIYVFLVTNPEKIAEPQADPTEEITAEFITQKQLWKLINQSKFSQALYISSLTLALRKLKQ